MKFICKLLVQQFYLQLCYHNFISLLKKDSQSPNSYLGQGITTITGLLMSMLFINHITPGGHSAIEQSLLYILLLSGQQIPQH